MTTVGEKLGASTHQGKHYYKGGRPFTCTLLQHTVLCCKHNMRRRVFAKISTFLHTRWCLRPQVPIGLHTCTS